MKKHTQKPSFMHALSCWRAFSNKRNANFPKKKTQYYYCLCMCLDDTSRRCRCAASCVAARFPRREVQSVLSGLVVLVWARVQRQQGAAARCCALRAFCRGSKPGRKHKRTQMWPWLVPKSENFSKL